MRWVPIRSSLAAAAVAVLAGVAVPGAGAQEADSGGGLVTVAGGATASGVRFTYEVPAEFLAATRPFDGGGPVAEASMGSGIARSAASLPFPGELVIAGPGLFYTVTGMTIPGSYPFYVAAEHPTVPKSELGDPSGQYQLAATATERAATSMAQGIFGSADGGSGGSKTSTSISSAADGSAEAVAESVTHGLSFGDGVLKIAAVRSTSVTRLGPTATETETDRKLVVEGATVAGQPVTIDAGGIKAGTAAAPVPFGDGAAQVSQALAQSGISARVLSEDDGAGGATEVLEVSSRHPLPFAGNPEGVFTWKIGKTTTNLVRTGFLPAPEPVDEDPATAQQADAPELPAALPALDAAPDQGGAAPSAVAPARARARAVSRPALPLPSYDPGPVSYAFGGETSGAVEEITAGPEVVPAPAVDSPATLLTAPAAAVRPEGLGRVRLLYVAVAAGAGLAAGLAGLWWKKGVSWAGS
jgi:hypothetical protein